jgi:O-antigen/teichoic acid export membrane protein
MRCSQIARAVKRQAAQDFFLTILTNVAISLFGALGGILAARLLGPEGRGELAAAVAWGGMFTVIMSLGMPQALTFFVARDVKTIGSVFSRSLTYLVISKHYHDRDRVDSSWWNSGTTSAHRR